MSDLIFKDSAILFYGACYFFLLWVLVNWSLKKEVPYQAFVGSFVMLLAGLYLSTNRGISVSENELSLLIISGAISYFVSIAISGKLAPKIIEFFSEEKNDSKENEKYITLIEKAVNLSIFFIPFLFLTNLIMQVVLPVFKTGDDNSVIEHLGTFGDFFGGTLNPVLTFATFIALIATILIQLKELRLTRKELKNSNKMLKRSRKEQSKTAKALMEQEKNQRKQLVDSWFFNLHQDLVGQRKEILFDARQLVLNMGDNKNLYDFLHEVFKNEALNRYFIGLYQIFNYVDSSELIDYDKKSYFNLMRSSVAQPLLVLLMFNCSRSRSILHDVDYYRYRDMIVRYSFFEHLDLITAIGLEFRDYSLPDIDNLDKEIRETMTPNHALSPDPYISKIENEKYEYVGSLESLKVAFGKYKFVKQVVDEYDKKSFGESRFLSKFNSLESMFSDL